jgi:uncharacterized protein (DUF433 family)
MIELTPEQIRALAQAGTPPTVVDPTTRQVYVLMPADAHAGVGGASSEIGCGSSREAGTPLETPVAPWKYLVARKHPWRKQLYIKGRNMTVRQLLSTVIPNGLTEEQAAADLDLPVEAIREALTYAKENAALLDFETAYERLRLEQRGKRLGPQSLPG